MRGFRCDGGGGAWCLCELERFHVLVAVFRVTRGFFAVEGPFDAGVGVESVAGFAVRFEGVSPFEPGGAFDDDACDGAGFCRVFLVFVDDRAVRCVDEDEDFG